MISFESVPRGRETATAADWRSPSADVEGSTLIRDLRVAICSSGELFGGVEEHVVTLARHLLERQGVQIVTVLSHHGALAKRLEASGVETIILADRHKYDPFAVSRTTSLFRRRGINVVHTHGYRATLVCGVAAKMCGAGFLKTEHGALEPMGSVLKRAKMRLNLALDGLITRRLADRIVYVSRDLVSRLPPGNKMNRVAVIPNGLDLPSEDDTAAPLNLALGNFNIGIVGRLSEVKGHSVLFRAVGRVTDCPSLVVHVFGEGRLDEALRAECARLGLAGQIRFHGFRNDIISCMKAMDVVVMPSLHEGMPYTLLQAMSLGLPVVASRVGGLREVLEDGQDALLAEPGDVEGVAAALRLLYRDRDLRYALGQSAQAKAQARYSAQGMVDRYVEVYQQVLPNE